MQFKTQRIEDALVVMMEGKLLSEQETSPIKTQLADELNNHHEKFIFDLKDVEFVNSSCLNFLVASKNIISGKNGTLILCNIPDQLKKLLAVTKLESFFTTTNRTADALDMIKKSSLE